MNARACLIAAGLAVLGLGSWTGAACAAADQSRAPTEYSAPALYNLGNSYARAGRPALAVLNYERARLLAPLDPDIQANLRHVRDAAGLPAQTGGWLSRHGRFANPDTMYWLGVLGLSLGGTSLLLRRLAKDRPRLAKDRLGSRHRGALAAVAALGLVLTVLALEDSLATASILAQSVVMQPSPASASPIQVADPLFTVPQADVVGVRDEHAGFALIRDSQGREGWVASSNLTAIIPADPR